MTLGQSVPFRQGQFPRRGNACLCPEKVWQFWGEQHSTHYNKFICISIAVLPILSIYIIFKNLSSFIFFLLFSLLSLSQSLLSCIPSNLSLLCCHNTSWDLLSLDSSFMHCYPNFSFPLPTMFLPC